MLAGAGAGIEGPDLAARIGIEGDDALVCRCLTVVALLRVWGKLEFT